MRKALIAFFGFALACLAGCGTFGGPAPGAPWGGVSRTIEAPIGRVKPAFVTTVVQMGMSIAALETRDGHEVLKARKADKSVEIEFERLAPNATRVRVTGSDQDAILRQTEKRLGGV